MRFTPQELGALSILSGLPDAHVAWFAEHGEGVELAGGEHMFERGQPAEFMFIVVGGAVEGYEEVAGDLLMVATTGQGQVTGTLPFSRMTHYPRYTVAVGPTRVLRVRKQDFPQMLAVSYEVGRRLVAEMSDRVRGDVRLEQLQERMAALGRLSAGLAHELNNPAAAMCRAASGLSDELRALSALVMNLARQDVQDAHVTAIDELYELASARAGAGVSPLVRSEREEELEEWLDSSDVPRSWDLAATFADGGLVLEDLQRFAEEVPAAVRADALGWVACRVTVQRIVNEIASSSGRISQLVGSVKTYTHMDRSPEHKPTDIRDGLDNTLTLLDHKLRQKGVRLVRDYEDDLPLVSANAGQLNQVWTSLVDNAIDAVGEGGEIRVGARRSEAHIDVTVRDDGHGIPPEIQHRIFEPFFTTKGVGEGTGLGLGIAMGIVKTHRGSLSVQSKSGETEAHVRLPVLPQS